MHALLSQVLPSPLFLAECYWPGITAEELTAADHRTQQALAEMGATAPAVRQAGSILIPTDELVFRLFLGGSIQALEAAHRRAAVPFARVIDAVAIDNATEAQNEVS